MYRLTLAVLVCIMLAGSLAISADTSSWVELKVKFKEEGSVGYSALNCTTYYPTQYFGVYSCIYASEPWGEAYCGPAVRPASWIEFGIAGGFEQDKNPWRLGSMLWVGYKRISFSGIAEKGGSGYYYSAKATFKLTGWLKAGVMSERFSGIGPRVDFQIPHTPLTIWAAPLYDLELEKHNTLVALRASF